MLTRLQFQNWRSLKSAVLDDLTPITVLIGANSSGKTNIVDGLRFMRALHQEQNTLRSMASVRYEWGGWESLRTVNAAIGEFTSLDVTLSMPQLTDRISLTHDFDFNVEDEDPQYRLALSPRTLVNERLFRLPVAEQTREVTQIVRRLFRLSQSTIALRWQILGEFAAPGIRVSEVGGSADVYKLSENASNLAYVIDNLRRVQPDAFGKLQDDASWLMSHVAKIDTHRTERELRVLLAERDLGQSAPTISAGTSRILAVLAAHFALSADRTPVFKGPDFEIRPEPDANSELKISDDSTDNLTAAELPGLIVVEEADASLNPGLLERFVSLLRTYTEADPPHQFILTTHNPAFLNFFEPNEVRVVSRDADGHTHISPVPQAIVDVWGDAYRLGDIWMTNVFGGLPE